MRFSFEVVAFPDTEPLPSLLAPVGLGRERLQHPLGGHALDRHRKSGIMALSIQQQKTDAACHISPLTSASTRLAFDDDRMHGSNDIGVLRVAHTYVQWVISQLTTPPDCARGAETGTHIWIPRSLQSPGTNRGRTRSSEKKMENNMPSTLRLLQVQFMKATHCFDW